MAPGNHNFNQIHSPPTRFRHRFVLIGGVLGAVIPLSYGLYLSYELVSRPPAPPLPPGMAGCGMHGLRILLELFCSFVIGPPLGALLFAVIGAIIDRILD